MNFDISYILFISNLFLTASVVLLHLNFILLHVEVEVIKPNIYYLLAFNLKEAKIKAKKVKKRERPSHRNKVRRKFLRRNHRSKSGHQKRTKDETGFCEPKESFNALFCCLPCHFEILSRVNSKLCGKRILL